MANIEGGSRLKDIILVRTTLPSGRHYAFHASYDPVSRRITRTWGGHHDYRFETKFTLPRSVRKN